MECLDHEADGTGYDIVDTTISCVLTRFRVRSMWSLFRFYRSYLNVRAETRRVSGLMASMFLVEDLHTCYTLSLWRDPGAILEFNSTVHAHIYAANGCFHQLRIDPGGPQIWSAQFRLSAVSPHNLRWDGVDVSSGLKRSVYAPGGEGHAIADVEEVSANAL